MDVQAQKSLMLKVEHLSKNYFIGNTSVPVLRDVMLNVHAGETVSIIGVSGAGKTTLLHILGGLDMPTGGSVVFQGKDLYSLSAAKRTRIRAIQIGFVFQFYYLLPELNMLENVMLPAMSRRRKLFTPLENFVSLTGFTPQLPGRDSGVQPSDQADQERALDLLKRVGLEKRSAHLPAELSGGEQQRAALARALMNEPDLVLADEPTGNLDSATGNSVLDTLFAMTRERGHTLILATHNSALAGRCDRVLKLQDGCLAFC